MPVRVSRSRLLQAGSAFATSVHAGGRYLLDQHGQPFLLHGDAPWLMSARIPVTGTNSFDTYFTARAGRRFNAIITQALAPLHFNDGRTVEGNLYPFVGMATAIDVTVPNEAYWARIDTILDLAEAQGITVILSMLSVWGWNRIHSTTSTTTEAITSQGTVGWNTYGQFLGARYGSRPNVLWLAGHDFLSTLWSTYDTYLQAAVDGLRTGGATQPLTLHLGPTTNSWDANISWDSRWEYSAAYMYRPTYAEVLASYAEGARPTVMIEATYEGENSIGDPYGLADAFIIRHQYGWSMTSGACGYCYGHDIWEFPTGWQNSLNTAAIDHLDALQTYFASLRWYDLAPDAALVTAGGGTAYPAGGTHVSTSDYVSRARTADGLLGVLYLPHISASAITVDETRITGAVTGQWVDPSTTATQAAVGSAGVYTKPGANAAGANDWLLVLEGSG